MEPLKNSLWKTILRGVAVVLPATLLVLGVAAFYRIISSLVRPVTNVILSQISVSKPIAEVISILVSLLFFLVVGWLVGTKWGAQIYRALESRLLLQIRGYRMIREVVLRFTGAKKPPFTRVALIKLAEKGQYVTGFITDEHRKGVYTVFVPEAPFPTTGQIYHLTADWVTPLDIPVEDAMQTIFGCGAGSSELLKSQMADMAAAPKNQS